MKRPPTAVGERRGVECRNGASASERGSYLFGRADHESEVDAGGGSETRGSRNDEITAARGCRGHLAVPRVQEVEIRHVLSEGILCADPAVGRLFQADGGRCKESCESRSGYSEAIER